jgi:hypothetical protein
MGYGLNIEFIDHLLTSLGTTSNYSATANLHKSQITTAPAKLLPSVLFLQQPFRSNGL